MIKGLLLHIIFLFLVHSTIAQLVFDKSTHNFGEINKEDKKYVDFTLTNAGKVPAEITKIEEPYGVDVKVTTKTIAPDSSVIIRVKYTPKRKGSYKADIPVWTNIQNHPITFTIEGNAKTFDLNESLECPDFEIQKKPEEIYTDIKIKVLDKATNQPIPNALVEIIWDGLIYKEIKTNRIGEADQSLKNDMYYIVVSAKDYGAAEQAVEVHQDSLKEITFYLGEPSEEPLIVQEIDTVVDPEIIPAPEDTISTKELPIDLYAPNNVVFLIDVSVSMKQKGRMDLLKAAMIELLNGLRVIDKLAIVTYASSTDVVLASQYVTDKAKITQIIQDLSAGGYTAGSKGVDKAYDVAKASKIKDGNNLVIIATDGAFNIDKGDKAIIKEVEKNAKNDIYMSVVGVKNERWTEKSMTKMAEVGNGSYIHIETYSQAKQTLMNEIKVRSRKK